jgi:hypothetical protein
MSIVGSSRRPGKELPAEGLLRADSSQVNTVLQETNKLAQFSDRTPAARKTSDLLLPG